MANNCYNIVHFEGENIGKAIEEFEKMQKKSIAGLGVVPDWFHPDKENIDFDKFIFCIQIDGEQISFETKWVPDPKSILAIALKYNLSFTLSYDEPGNGVYGKFEYDIETKELKDYCLDFEDFHQYTENDEAGYTFEGENYESEYDILDILFERKFNIKF